MIEIPGYRVLRPLGRGGMASVHLALQESVQREVALKIMSPMLAADPQFGDRFLREARIAAKLHHRHVVQVHDVGVCGDHHYIAMEYISGGAVLKKGESGRGVAYSLRVIREIASALDYAHLRGVIHRDIKPDNILLREDGSAVLTDFGIARANDGTRMTRTGAIIGTPHYMSPEQARGHTVDGRADLYSLGVLLHEMLVGRVPYEAEDSLAVGIMHITAPLPKLPDAIAALQPLLDQMLAKEPGRRFQTGDQLAQAIEKLERTGAAQGGHTQITPADFRRSQISQPTVQYNSPVPADDNSQSSDFDGYRPEPRLGRLDEVAATTSGIRRPGRRQARPWRWVAAAAVLAACGLGAWHFQDQLRDLIPETRQRDTLERAQSALLEGRLLYAADGGSARELFNQVLAQDPDNLQARQGLQQVGEALLQRAGSALKAMPTSAPELDAIESMLSSARELGVAEQKLQVIEDQLRQQRAAGTADGLLLQQAQRAFQSGDIDGTDGSAVALYAKAMRLNPQSTQARDGMANALDALLAKAVALIETGEADAAGALIDRVASINPSHLGLPASRVALSDLRTQQEAGRQRAHAEALARQLTAAESLLSAGKLDQPADDNALRAYRAILAANPGNADAAKGLRRVAAALVQQAQRKMADFHFDEATALLDSAQSAAPGMADIATARKHLIDLYERQSRVTDSTPSNAITAEQVRTLLSKASRAADAGRLVFPPGDSAYDNYRAVLSLVPGEPTAREGLARLPSLASQLFEEALGNSRFSDARGYVDALQSLAPADRRLPSMQQRLGRALFGVASERLGAGELQQARRALDQARELDPSNPEIPSLQARIEQASGG